MALFMNQAGDDGLPGKERLFAMLAVMITTTMNVFDGSMINIALPQMSTSLGVSASEAVWVANGYLLAVAMSLAIFSALATRIGFRKQFIGGLIVFTLSSVGCALSSSLSELVVMRFIQGIGGAATLSIAPALLRRIFPTRLLGRILGMNALLVATCTAVAPLISGALLVTLSWPWLFMINAPLGVIAVVFSKRFLPQSAQLDTRPLDKIGALLSVIMLGSTILCANSFSKHVTSDNEQQALFYAVTALVSGIAFVYRQRRTIAPLLPLEIFSNQRFSLSAITSFISFIAQGIIFIALPFLYEGVYGYSPLASALLFLPWPVGIILAAPHAGRLADKKNPAMISTFGLVIFGMGSLLLIGLPQTPSVLDIAWRSLVCGIGFGLFQSPNNREMMANVQVNYSSYASGVLAMMRTFGQCLGTAVIGIILSQSDSLASSSGNIVHLGLWFASGSVFLAILFSVSRIKK
ncbi:DHA2 family efflux MFS transporter permease subunit [Vibrio gazogenes]|uniref:MFS transporter n=1 Tax=Vibrio gazogenes TaxID=687 RepID=A0A1Z2SL37_VIBGA|nr:DHA2 family efflux MFS transporter permease subunit [Vibrio gazogenes]ASA57836.1 MFS transporter [Vibrio gazogenes]